MSDELKNFMMIIPNDIERHPDGSPVLFVEPLHKEMFINWAFAQKIDLESMDVKQREDLFREWKNTYNPPDIKREWDTTKRCPSCGDIEILVNGEDCETCKKR